MILDVAVTEYRHVVSPREIGLTRDRQTVARLRSQYAPLWYSNASTWQWQAELESGMGFQGYVDKYSEVVTLNPWDDIDLFYRRAARAERLRNSRDIVFRDDVSRRLALVEVKSSAQMGDPKGKLTTEMIKLLRVLAPTKFLHPRQYQVVLAMVQVAAPDEVNLTSLVLEEA